VEGNPHEEGSIHQQRLRWTGVVTVIAIVGFGLVALAVLALAVGLFDAAQAGRLRWVARDRRAAWEQKQRAAATSTRNRYRGF
jgi:hypothetical protein